MLRKQCFVLFLILSLFFISLPSVNAKTEKWTDLQLQTELNYQDLPEQSSDKFVFSGKAQELETGSFEEESRGEKTTLIIISIIAGGMALGGILVPILLK